MVSGYHFISGMSFNTPKKISEAFSWRRHVNRDHIKIALEYERDFYVVQHRA
jgi:hypothetical protein